MQKQTIKLFWDYSKPYAARRWFALIHSGITILVSAFIGPFILSQLFTKIQDGSVTLDTSWMLIGSFVASQVYGEIIGWRLNLLALWTFETAAQRDLYRDIFSKLSTESLDFHSNRFGGSLVSQANKLNGAFERFWDTLVFQAVPVVVSIIAATTILWFYFWQYALFLLVLSIGFSLAVFYGSRFMRELNIKEAQASTKMTGRLADIVTNIATVKSYATEQTEVEGAGELSEDWRNRSLATMRGFLLVSTGYSSMNVMLTTAALVFAIIASERQIISIAAVYLALTYTFTVSRQLWEINHIMRNYNRIIGDAHDMVEILGTEMSIADDSKKTLTPTQGAIQLKDITFTHDKGEGSRVFSKLSLDIKAGQKVGIVGHSGSGKTTMTRLLLRFADVDKGEILIDGQNIAKVSQQSLRESIAYVPQEPLLFHRSLRENIIYGKPDATDDEIRHAAKQAHALEFIDTLPEGLETTVGERGVKLSGGQRQRIAIARAILKNSPILVLDEATSALDSESEKLIQASLDILMKNRTSIVIAHRLSTIAKLDRIIVLEKGNVVEDGSHKQLLDKGGIYASLWNHQSGGFIEE